MIINNDLTSFTVLDDSPLSDALNLININKSGFVLVIDLKGKLVGIITDGDFRRWMLKNGPSLDVQASVVANKDVVTAPWKERVPLSEIQHLFSEAIKHLPLVDRSGRLMAVASGTRLVEMKIGQKVLSEDAPAFLIAEIGNNHNGSVERAFKLVDLAFNAGADCAKFQMRDLNSLYTGANYVSGSEDLGSEYTIDLLKRFQLNDEEMFRVFDYCKTKGILPLCTPWDEVSLDKLEKYRMAAYKVASADLTNHRLIERLCETRKPLIVSTGMSMEDEIKETVAIFQQKAASFALLHCNSTYPAPFKDLNLQFMNRLKEIGQNCLVGYSGHERGYFIPIAAVALGAKIIEKHFTMSKSMEGNDHKVSLLPHEFSAMVDDIRNTEEAIGGNTTRKLSQGELINREVLGKSLVAAQEIKKGTALSKDLLTVRGPGKGIQPNRINELLGVVVKRNINEGDYIFDSDISEDQVTADNYSFNRPFGIPIRFHDYEKLACCSNLDFVEFHLSYNDLDLELSKYIGKKSEIGFAVHSPELFKGDHILDLCSDDDDYRQQSISNLLRVIDKTEELKAYFPAEKRPVIIVNVGGGVKMVSSMLQIKNESMRWSRKQSTRSKEIVLN